MSQRLARLSLRFVVAAALLGCLVPELPFGGQVHAATQPQASGVIPSSGRMSIANATFSGPPGTTVAVGPNGVITVSGTTQPVTVTPNPGYVLALYNPTTGQWQVVSNNTIVPGTGSYALKSRSSVAPTRCSTSQAPASKQKGKAKATAPKRKGKAKATAPKKKGKATASKQKGAVTSGC